MSRTQRRAWGALVMGLGVVMGLSGCAAFGQNPEGSDLARIGKSPHFKGGVFINPKRTRMGFDLGRMQYMWNRRFDDTVRTPPGPIPVRPVDAARFKAPWTDGVRATWVGHSTVLVELDGFRVLTDPIWSERCSPVAWAGPSRYHKPALAFKDLPKIDAVIISHDHYDHLDKPTVERLTRRGATFYVPLGVGSHFRRWGVKKVVELDWWQGAKIRRGGKTLTVMPTPARHFSGRGPFERNRTQWASWAILGPKARAWFGGDTGYFAGFREIGQKLGPFDLTIIPIGAYDRAWQDVHLNPEEAVQVHADVRGRAMMPVHWGTFTLGLHAWNEPANRLVVAAKGKIERLWMPRPGEAVMTNATPELVMWWQDLVKPKA